MKRRIKARAVKREKTNFERIKDMDKETMGAYLYSLGNADEYCSSHCAFDKRKCHYECKDGHLKWLDSTEGGEDFENLHW